MDPLSAIGLVSAGYQLISVVAQYSVAIVSRQQRVLVQRFGWPLGLFISSALRDTANRYQRIEEEVLNGTDEEALAFKQSITDECNMTAVAVSPCYDTLRCRVLKV